MPEVDGELTELWTGVFGEPPSITAPIGLLVQVLVAALPPAPPYEPVAPADGATTGPVYRTGTDG